MSDPIAMIGLGLMGGTLASHLLAEGRDVIGYDPVAERGREHADRGGTVAESVTEAVGGVKVAVLSLPTSAIMVEVCREIAAAATGDLLLVDTTTGDPDEVVVAAGFLAEAGVGYVDATVSGNAAMAAARDVIFMVGGNDANVAVAAALLEPLARRVYPVGPVGAGSRAKLVVNHILSINRTALAEGLTVAEKAGLDLDSMLEVLIDSAAYSRAMDIWGARMVGGDYDLPASRVRQGHKDSRLINAHAESLGASHDLVQTVRAILAEAEEAGLSDADQSAIMEVMRRRAGMGRL